MKKSLLLFLAILLSGCANPTAMKPSSTPEITLEATETAVSEPEVLYDFSVPLQAGDPVEESYFDDVVFIGDSRFAEIVDYKVLPNTTVLAGVALSVNELDTKKIVGEGEEKKTVLEALAPLDCRIIYICFGINELGYSYPKIFLERYSATIDQIRAIKPDTPIIVSTLYGVTQKREEKHYEYENRARIDEYNELIRQMAQNKGLFLLEIGEAVEDENGYLISEYTEDGVHLNITGFQYWLDYVKTHTMEGNQQ